MRAAASYLLRFLGLAIPSRPPHDPSPQIEPSFSLKERGTNLFSFVPKYLDPAWGNGPGTYNGIRGAWFRRIPPIAMDNCPFDSKTPVKRKIEPYEGLFIWFGDVPEGGLTEDTYLCGCVLSIFMFRAIRGFFSRPVVLTSLVLIFTSLFS